ncbi:MAG: aconitate hydratase [Gemmatimonadetes bacterium]|nr:aconitate hydratase [Gemmatimonadota bacterium]
MVKPVGHRDPFGARERIALDEGPTVVYRVRKLEELGVADIDRLPFSIRVLLENALRHAGRGLVTEEHVEELAKWGSGPASEIPFMPTRVVLQDFTGVPAVVDLAAMRSALARMGGDPERINPVVPADLVIDHSVQVDFFGSPDAFRLNVQLEMERNRERYALLRWAQRAFKNFRVVPPGTGIVHQVNLEYLASVFQHRLEDGEWVAYPDTLVGTDSHTTMINGLGVLGWGVGGIEAEAVLLGQPYYMLVPEVVGMKLTGALPEGSTATDLVLTVTQILRKKGVVGRFVEFFGPGLSTLPLPDRATISNMAPEYGATVGFFPVDAETLRYLAGTGRDPELVQRAEYVAKELALFRTDDMPDPVYTDVLELDLSTVEPSMAGPKRPQDRLPLRELNTSFYRDLAGMVPAGFKLPCDEPHTSDYWTGEGGRSPKPYLETSSGSGGPAGAGTRGTAVAEEAKPRGRKVEIELEGRDKVTIGDGSVVIAAITSCTNTSNPSVMVGAGLLAKKAIERGLEAKPWVKTSMAPGSRVVTDYLEGAGVLPYLEALRFQVVGYGCTTCIGNSGPLPGPIADAIKQDGLVVAAVLSGNRNFEARIHPQVRANYLASPMLVVAFALAGRVDVDLLNEPLGHDRDGRPVYLRDIWPSPAEIRSAVSGSLRPEMFQERYAHVFDGDETWQTLPVPEGGLYEWDPSSTYIAEPPFFEAMSPEPPPLRDVVGARVLALLGDSVTTDHISPAGAIAKDGPAGRYLIERGVQPMDFNTFGARRGTHEVMMRGTFANVRIKNLLLEGKEGGYTLHFPTGEVTSIYEAAMRYRDEGTPLLVIAGKAYGGGSSRDWAAKGTALLGVRAVLAESYERIHRSNLVGMGVLPLQFRDGDSAATLGLTGREIYEIRGIADGLEPHAIVEVTARDPETSKELAVDAVARLDSAVDVDYYRNAGILHTVLRKMGAAAGGG